MNAFKLLLGLLKPVLPRIAEGVEEFLNIEPITFANIDRDIIDHKINPYQRLAERLDREAEQELNVVNQEGSHWPRMFRCDTLILGQAFFKRNQIKI